KEPDKDRKTFFEEGRTLASKTGRSARKPAVSKKMPTTYEELLRMAKQYGVDQNALFLAAAKQYDLQQRVIEMLKAGIEDGELTTSKTYIAGQSNDYAAPLVKELPKHSDAANRTAGIILDIIVKLGQKPDDTAGGLELNLDDI
ncbi:MAG: hypothetical protein UHU21_02700, partial [Lachnospiraceae bacterium]|nr:hypothetical protein [Lachnospiraceae bacterium]